MNLKSFIISAITTITLLSAIDINAQSSSIPNYVEIDFNNYNWTQWAVSSNRAKVLRYRITDWGNYLQAELDCDKWELMRNIRPLKIISGEKNGNYIYEVDVLDGYIYVYNAADFSTVTSSNYIPLKYGGSKGVKLDNGATMYIVPFKAGKYSVTGFISKKQLTGTYVLIIRYPRNSDNYYPAAVNIKKTKKGYDLSNACAIYSKSDESPKNVVSTSGQLLKHAITIDGSGSDYPFCPEWIVEYNGLCDGGTPLGAVKK